MKIAEIVPVICLFIRIGKPCQAEVAHSPEGDRA